MLMDLLPSYCQNSEEMAGTLRGFDKVLADARNAVDDVQNQLFLYTATWGLNNWERLVGLPSDETKTDGDRRARVAARLRGSGATTKAMVENVAASYAKGEIQVIEDVARYIFFIRFVGQKGVPQNLDDLRRSIEGIKPAHLAVEYLFTYAVLRDYAAFTLEALAPYTLEELALGAPVNGGNE